MTTSFLVLPQLPRDSVAPQNDLHQPRRLLDLGDGLTLGDLNDTPPPLGPHCARVDMLIGGHPVTLFGTDTLLPHLLASQAIEAPHAAPDTLALLLELALDRLLGQLETVTGQPIVITAGYWQSPPLEFEAIHWMRLSQGEQAWPVGVAGPLAVLQPLFASWPVAQIPVADLPVAAIIRLGVTTLPASVVNSLSVGDAILFERFSRMPNGGKLVIANHLIADAAWDKSWRVLNAPSAQHPDHAAWLGQPRVPTGEDMTNGPHDVPVTICFDLGDANMPIGTIAQINIGAALTLPGATETPIRLTVDGHSIGSGDAVRIEGKPGVRILKLFSHI